MPPADHPPVLVWRRGDALLAAHVDAVVEVAAVAPDGTARSRAGDVPLSHLPGLAVDVAPTTRAVVVRTADAVAALPADSVEGIRAIDAGRVAPPPDWLDALDPVHLRGIVVLDDDRLAALLALDHLPGRP